MFAYSAGNAFAGAGSLGGNSAAMLGARYREPYIWRLLSAIPPGAIP